MSRDLLHRIQTYDKKVTEKKGFNRYIDPGAQYDTKEVSKEVSDGDRRSDTLEQKKQIGRAIHSDTHEAILSFEQELVPRKSHHKKKNNKRYSNGLKFVPRDSDHKPKGVHGKIEITFDPDLSKAYYSIYVFGLKDEPRYINEWITQVHIHAGRTDQIGPVVVVLFRHGRIDEKGVQCNGLVTRGTITNSNIIHSDFSGFQYNTIASLYSAIRDGRLYADVHGSNVDRDEISYAQGLLRGHIFTTDVI